MVATTPGKTAVWVDRAKRAALVAALIIFVAIAVAFVRTIVGTWHATGDQALIELRTFDVGGRHTPLIGPYSRFGWNHPGPSLFYALAPALRGFGGRDVGILAGGLSINALALASMFVITRRRGDAAAWVLVVLVAAIFVRAPSAEALFDPWNPYVIVLPLLAAAVCAWSAAAGGRWSLVATVVLTSFVAQTHIGAALPAAALALLAVLWSAVGIWNAPTDARSRCVRSIAIALGVGIVVWLPPIVQAATSSGGNLRAIWDFWSAGYTTDGFALGARFTSMQYAIPAPWMGATEHTSLGGALLPSTNRFPVALILLTVATIAVVRRRDHDAIALCSLAWALALATWIAASSIVDGPIPYLLRWAWVSGAIAWLAIAWCGARLIPPRASPARAAALAAGALAAVIVAVLIAVSAARTPFPVRTESHTLEQIREPVLAALRHAQPPVLIESGSSLPVANVAAGLFLDATRAGIAARVPVPEGYRVDTSRALHGRPGSVLLVTTDAAAVPRERGGGYRLVAAYDALDPADRRALDRLVARVSGRFQDLIDLERDHPRDYAHLQSLKARDVRIAVFLGTG